MGTRSLTYIKENNSVSKTICCIYRQYDGYPEGHGRDLFNTFGKTKIINGYGDQKAPLFANGMGCFAAQVINNLKTDIGGIYLYPPDSKDVWEEYTYTFYLHNEILYLKVVEVCGEKKRKIFDAPFSGFGEYLKETEQI